MPKTIFITGGSTGIGAASVFANAGIHRSNTLLDEAAPDEPAAPVTRTVERLRSMFGSSIFLSRAYTFKKFLKSDTILKRKKSAMKLTF